MSEAEGSVHGSSATAEEEMAAQALSPVHVAAANGDVKMLRLSLQNWPNEVDTAAADRTPLV
jgi:hypothetical protein